MTINWEELERGWNGEIPKKSFAPLPKGSYKVRIEKYEFGTSKEKGTPYMKWQMQVLEPEKYNKRKLFHSFWLTPKTIGYVARDVETVTGKRITGPTELKNINYTNAGAFYVTIVHEEYKGDIQERVKYINPLVNTTDSKPPVDESWL